MESPSDPSDVNRRNILMGVGLWAVVCLLAVAVRGVRWDENYEFAQVITRAVPYPDAHPLLQYAGSMFSIQPWSLAALLRCTLDPALLCGLRNLLFLIATVGPAFFLGALLSRRVLWGHLAAAAMLLGAHLAFYSTYPQFVWPHMYSNGHIGTAYALIAVCLLAAGRLRAGFFLVGLMPSVHLGQWPPVLALAALFIVGHLRRRQTARLMPALAWAAAGLALSAAFWYAVRMAAVPDPTSGPYVSATDARAVWLGYMARHASHRSMPWTTGHIALVALPFLSLAAARNETRHGNPTGPWRCVLVYALCVAGIVWLTMAVHAAMGPRIPFLLISWMPYRLMNHIPPLLVIATIAILAGRGDRKGAAGALVAALLMYGIAKPGLRTIVGDALYTRYLETGIGAVFLMTGAATAVLSRQLKDDRRFLAPWLAAGLAGWVILVTTHQFGAVCCALGFAAAFILDRPLPTSLQLLRSGRLLAALAVVLVATLVCREWAAREHLPVSPFERHVAQYLDKAGEPNAMLVADYQQEGLQARTDHPVITDMATITWIAYKPSLGPALDKLYGDLYGIRFTDQHDNEPPKPWFEHWAGRSRGQWRNLGTEYDFQYIIAPNFITLDLPQIIEGQTESLYHVPENHARTPAQ